MLRHTSASFQTSDHGLRGLHALRNLLLREAFFETDFSEDLSKFDFATLVLHGEDDQVVPVKNSARKCAKLVKGAREIYYPGAPHGLTATHQDQVNADPPAFLTEVHKGSKAAKAT